MDAGRKGAGVAAVRRMKLIDQIGRFSAPSVFNPWRDTDRMDVSWKAPLDRQKRLYEHFNCEPRFLLIGEAPGYQGCHFSGIPFTNEKLLLSGVIPRVEISNRITTRNKPWSEPSATVVWNTLHDLKIADHTVMWNAFGWHPYKDGNYYSNRKPTTKELQSGRHILKAVCEHFSDAKVIAVGRVAEGILKRLDISSHSAVRHPSMGGATLFREQMKAIAK